MARSERRLHVKRRLQGVAFLAVVAALLGLTVAIYNKSLPWQAADTVTMQAERIGNQLVVPADVKLEGILVGRVSAVSSDGEHATLTLKIDKSKIHEIPADVVARILPKTLFGEKYIELVVPPAGSNAQPLRPGSVIQQDRSTTAIELQTVFNDLVPVLRALKPAELSIALSNMAEALRNRGDALGHNLELVNTYFTRFNADRLITLAKVSKPVLDLYATFSPVLECLPNGLAIYDRTRLEQAFGGGPYLHITLTPVGDRGAYTAQDAPRKTDLTSFNIPPTAQNGQGCYGLPYGSHSLHPVNSAFPGPHPSGNYACAGTPPNPACPIVPGGPPANPGTRTGAVGSAAEQNLLGGLFAPMVGTNVSAGLEDLLLGPILRGMNVSVTT